MNATFLGLHRSIQPVGVENWLACTICQAVCHVSQDYRRLMMRELNSIVPILSSLVVLFCVTCAEGGSVAPKEMDNKSVELGRLLVSTNAQERWKAGIGLAQLGDSSCLPVLKGVLRTADTGTRYLAAASLGKIRDREAVLAFLLEIDINQQSTVLGGRMVDEELIRQLRGFHQKRAAFDKMKSFLKSDDPVIALAAAKSLGEFTCVDAITEIEPLVLSKDLDAEVRVELLSAMQQATAKRLKSVYSDLSVHSEQERVRQAATTWVKLIESANEVIITGRQSQLIAETKQPLTAEERESIWRLLDDPDKAKVRKLDALRKLGGKKDSESVERLMALCDKTDDVQIRGSVLVALAQIGDKRAIPLGERLALSPAPFVADMAKLLLKTLRDEKPPLE